MLTRGRALDLLLFLFKSFQHRHQFFIADWCGCLLGFGVIVLVVSTLGLLTCGWFCYFVFVHVIFFLILLSLLFLLSLLRLLLILFVLGVGGGDSDSGSNIFSLLLLDTPTSDSDEWRS